MENREEQSIEEYAVEPDPPIDKISRLRLENLELLKRGADIPGNEDYARFLEVNRLLDNLESGQIK